MLREAETLAEALDDLYRLGLVVNYLGHYHWTAGEPTQAEIFGQRAVALATGLEHIDLQIVAKTYLGYTLHSLGNYQQARHCFTTVVTSLTADLRYEFLDMGILPSVVSRVWLAWTFAEMGVFSEAIIHGEEGLRIAEARDHSYTHTHACFGIGLAYIRQGEFIKAIPVLERGHTISQTYMTTASTVNDAHLGYALALSGRVPEAISLLEDAHVQTAPSRASSSCKTLRQQPLRARGAASAACEGRPLARYAGGHRDVLRGGVHEVLTRKWLLYFLSAAVRPAESGCDTP